MPLHLPPIVRTAERLLLEIERAVRRFARFHKYGYGEDLRKRAMKIAVLSQRAWREVEQRSVLLVRLDRSVSKLRLLLQIGSRLKAFASFGEFEALSRLVSELGKQVGGWSRPKSHPKGQNAARDAVPQRPQTLSPRAARDWANA